jgi:hypothetical protein
MMKTQKVILKCAVGALVTIAPAIASAEDDVPKPLAFARYQQMVDRSPFAVATAAAPPPAAAPDFAKDLYIANAAHSPNGDLITLASNSDKNFKKYLTTKESIDGFGVSNIEWSDKVGATKVTITKDGQFATLGFNQALLSQPLPNQPSQPGVPSGIPASQPNMPVPTPPPQNPQVRPAPIPSIPTPPPHVRGVIPRNPATTMSVPPPAAPAPEH